MPACRVAARAEGVAERRCQLVRDQPARMWRVARVVLVSAVSRPNSGLSDVLPGGVRLGAELSVGGGG